MSVCARCGAPSMLRRGLGETVGGNPLIVEELLAMLPDLDAESLETPPTIQALLGARLDSCLLLSTARPSSDRRSLARRPLELGAARRFSATS